MLHLIPAVGVAIVVVADPVGGLWIAGALVGVYLLARVIDRTINR